MELNLLLGEIKEPKYTVEEFRIHDVIHTTILLIFGEIKTQEVF